jgi:hypothetical protein
VADIGGRGGIGGGGGAAPELLQRCQTVVYVEGPVACQVPLVTDTGTLCWTPRVLSAARPVETGGSVVTTPEGTASAVVVPDVLVALTAMVIVDPSSMLVSW